MRIMTVLLCFISISLALELSQLPKNITLEGENGAKISGEAFSSDSLKGKVHVLFYVDPDEKEMNEHVSAALKNEHFERKDYASVAIINMAATWLPNFAIASKLEKKQTKYPDTIYVKDLNKVLVNEWDLQDNSSNVLLFDKSGKLLFIKKEKLNTEEVQTLITLIKENI